MADGKWQTLHVRGLLDKIGVKPDLLTEGAYKSAAELFMREQPSPEADETMNWLMDSWYAHFKAQIAEGRKAEPGKVQAWLDSGLFTADQAKASGLIDRLGTLSDAVAFAADQANLKDYGVRVVPEPKSFLEQLTERTSGDKNQPGHISGPMGENSLYNLEAPYLQNLDPQRTAAVMSALRRLEILQREGIVVSMPEIVEQP